MQRVNTRSLGPVLGHPTFVARISCTGVTPRGLRLWPTATAPLGVRTQVRAQMQEVLVLVLVQVQVQEQEQGQALVQGRGQGRATDSLTHVTAR